MSASFGLGAGKEGGSQLLGPGEHKIDIVLPDMGGYFRTDVTQKVDGHGWKKLVRRW